MHFLWLIILQLPLTAFAASSSWTTARPDHFNLLYSAGEIAKIQLRVVNRPTDPAYGVYITAQEVGLGSPAIVPLQNGVGEFRSSPLTSGSHSYQIVTHFTAPDAPTDQIVQTDILQLQVN